MQANLSYLQPNGQRPWHYMYQPPGERAQINSVFRAHAVAIVDAPDDETAAKLSLVNAANGRVRIRTMRAFTEEETVALATSLPA